MRQFLRFSPGVSLLLLLPAAVHADPPRNDEDTPLKNSLAVQQALAQARHHMYTANAARAVEVLEEQLPRINGNSAYLRTLREAYRSYIQELWLANNGKQARRYLERLCVLDPSAAQDPVLCGLPSRDKAADPPVAKSGTGAAPFVSAPQALTAPPKSTAALPSTPPVSLQSQEGPKSTPPPPKPIDQGPIFRGKIDDPFALTNRLRGGDGGSLARELQMQGEAQYARRQYEEARKSFQRATRPTRRS